MNSMYQVPSDDMAVMAPILFLYTVILLVMILVWILNYILHGISVYSLAKKQGLPAPFLAWIPYARTYLCGQLAGEISLGKRTLRHPGLWLLFIPIICSALLVIALTLYFVSLFVALIYSGGASDSVYSLLVFWIVILCMVSLINTVATSWISILVYTNIFKKYGSENMALTHAILSTFVPLYSSIYLFMLSRRVTAASFMAYTE